MELVIPHRLGREVARRRLADGIDRLARDHRDRISSVTQSWAGHRFDFSFGALGCRAAGSATVEEDCIRVVVALPLALRVFAPLARDYLLREGTAFLARAEPAPAA